MRGCQKWVVNYSKGGSLGDNKTKKGESKLKRVNVANHPYHPFLVSAPLGADPGGRHNITADP